jgi:hypothetical protein
MATPNLADVHVDAPLSTMSVAYFQELAGVARKVFPVVPVSKQSNKYFTWTKADLYRVQAALRGPGTKAHVGSYGLSTSTYSCDRYALAKMISDPVRENYDEPLNADQAALKFLAQQLMMKEDALFAAAAFVTGVWGTERAGVASGATGTQFNRWDASGSTPIKDIRDMRRSVKNKCGLLPNVLVISGAVEDALVNHADILARVNGGSTVSQPGQVTNGFLAQLFGVDEVLVAETIQNTAADGATASLSSILGKHALLAYRAPAPSIDTPSSGYLFSWSPFDAGRGGAMVKAFRDEAHESDVLEANIYFDIKVTASDAGGFFLDAVS